MSAATEASLDDIVHSYGGIRVIKMTGDNTPSHMIDAYKELLNMRRSHSEFDELSFNLSECDVATMKSINRDVFHFLQSIVNDWNHDLDDRHHAGASIWRSSSNTSRWVHGKFGRDTNCHKTESISTSL